MIRMTGLLIHSGMVRQRQFRVFVLAVAYNAEETIQSVLSLIPASFSKATGALTVFLHVIFKQFMEQR